MLIIDLKIVSCGIPVALTSVGKGGKGNLFSACQALDWGDSFPATHGSVVNGILSADKVSLANESRVERENMNKIASHNFRVTGSFIQFLF